MNRTLKRIITLILAVTMLFGIVSTTAFAVADGALGQNGSGGNLSTSGSIDTGWCNISYDGDKIEVVLDPDAQSLLEVSEEQLKEVIGTLTDAIKAVAIEDIKEGIEDYLGGDGVQGFDKNNVVTSVLDLYIADREGIDDYVDFLKALINEANGVGSNDNGKTDKEKYPLLYDFIDYTCGIIKVVVGADQISLEELPTDEQIKETLSSTFEQKINVFVDSETKKYIESYISWLFDNVPTTMSGDIKGMIDGTVENYVVGIVNGYLGYITTENSNWDTTDPVNKVFKDYMDTEIKNRVDTWVKNYANYVYVDPTNPENNVTYSKSNNSAAINNLIDAEIDEWVTAIINGYPDNIPNNPISEEAKDYIEGLITQEKIDEEVLEIIEDYLSDGKILDKNGNPDTNLQTKVEGFIKDYIVTHKSTLASTIYNSYWTKKSSNALTGSFWTTVDNEIWNALSEEMREITDDPTLSSHFASYIITETEFKTATTQDKVNALKVKIDDLCNLLYEQKGIELDFDAEAKKEVENQISSQTGNQLAAWNEVWNMLSDTEKDDIMHEIEQTTEFQTLFDNKVKDTLREYWINDTEAESHKQTAIQHIINSSGYQDLLDTLIYDAEHAIDQSTGDHKYSHLIEAEVNKYLYEDGDNTGKLIVLDTLKTMLSTLDATKKATIKTAIENKANSLIADKESDDYKELLDKAFIAEVGITKAEVKEKIDKVFVPNFLKVYGETIVEIENTPGLNYEDLIPYLKSVKINDDTVLKDAVIDIDAIKSLLSKLPKFSEIAEMEDDEMRLDYRIVIDTTVDVSTSFTVTVRLGDGYERVRRFAGLIAKYVTFTVNDTDVDIDVKVPAKFSELVLKAAKSDKIPDSIKNKIFKALSKNVDDAHAFLNSFTFDELLDLLDRIDFEEVLDSEYLENFESLQGLSPDEVKAKLAEYEQQYEKVLKFVNRIYKNRIPASVKDKEISDFYNGDGAFSFASGDRSVTVDATKVEKYLVRFSEKFGPIVAAFVPTTEISASLDIDIEFEKINKVDFVVAGETYRAGFLPAGADVSFFSGITSHENKRILAWAEADGTVHTKMPDKDVVLHAVIDPATAVLIPTSVNKVYNGAAEEISVILGNVEENSNVTYQWYKDGTLIAGATADNIVVTGVSDSGEYYCIVNVDGTVIETAKCTVTISKAEINLANYEWKPESFIYDGTEKAVYLTDSEGNVLTFGATYYGNKATLAGVYTASVGFDSANFNVVGNVAAFEWNIEKAVYDMSGVSFNSKTVIYDGKAHSLEIGGTLPEGVTVEYSGKDFVNPGVYEVTAIFTGDENYEDIASMSAKLTIIGFRKLHTVNDTDGTLILKITATNGVLETYTLNLKDVTPSYTYLENEALFGEGKVGYVGGAYDIHFVEDGTEQPVNDSFKVQLLLPASLRNSEKEIKVVYVADNGDVTDMKAVRDGDYMFFDTTHFSVYAIVEIDNAPVVVEEADYSWIWIIVAILLVLIVLAVIIIIVIRRRKGNSPDEPIDVPVAEEPVAEEPIAEEPIAEEPIAEEPAAEESAAEEPVAEEPVAEEPVVEEPVVEEPVKAEPKAIVPPVIKTEDGEEGERIVNGEVVHVRYRTSFMSRLIQAEEPIQDYYTVIKNALLSYKGVKARTSWNFESFNKARIQCAKLNVKGNAFQVYLGLNPSEYNANKYHFVDVSDKPKLDKVPMMLKIKSERGLKYALELIEEMMNKFGIERGETPEVDYHMPYETTEALAARDLVKVILPAGVTLDGDENLVKVDVGELIENANANADKTEKEPVAEVTVAQEPVEPVFVDAEKADELISDVEAEAKIEIVEKEQEEKVKGNKLSEINLDTICENFEDGETVTLKALKAKRLVSPKTARIKVLARGIMTKKLTVYADKFSIQAVKMITLAGGHADLYK